MSARAQDWRGRDRQRRRRHGRREPQGPDLQSDRLGLKEDWTIGGRSAAGDQALARPWCIAVDGEGLLYVLDVQDACVKVFDRTGAYVRAIGRRGQGPGEIGAAFSIMIPAKSKTLIFNDVGGRPPRFLFLWTVRFRRTFPSEGSPMIQPSTRASTSMSIRPTSETAGNL